MPAELTLAAQLFSCTFSVLTNSCRMASYVVTRSPKPLLQTICCLGGGASSSEIQLSPLSSRTVLSRTTLKFFLMNVGFVRASCSAVVIPSVFSFFEILRPTPQISSTGCSDSSFSVRRGLPGVNASTPPNCGHSLEAHCADFASVFVGPIPTPMVSPVPERTCSHSCRPKSSKSMQQSMPRISRNILSMLYCSTRGANSSR